VQCRAWLASASECAELLEASEGDYTLSQTPRFGEALARAFGEYTYEPWMFDFSDGRRVLLSLVRVRRRPARLRCFEGAPFGLNAAPIVTGGRLDHRHVTALFDRLQPDMLHINTGATIEGPWSVSDVAGIFEASESSSHVLELEGGMERIWGERFTPKVRNQCRSAVRKGVEVREATGSKDFESYYAIYASAARGWGYAFPPYPRSLFEELAGLLGQGVELKLAWLLGRPIAGILLFHGRWSTLYWGAAMLKEFGSYSPHNALLRTAIEDACQRGMKQFDFGSSGNLESVRGFKESFGARPVRYWDYAFASSRYRLLARLKNLFPRVAGLAS
jgi:CelD/BcsL family acetyltransferase involved in cellulose biosynthesis